MPLPLTVDRVRRRMSVRLIRKWFPESSASATRQILDVHHQMFETNLKAAPIVGVLAASIFITRTPTIRLVIGGLVILAFSGLLMQFGVPRAAAGTNQERQRTFLMLNGAAGVVWGGYFALILPPTAAAQSWLAIAVPLAMVANMIEAAPVAHSFLGFHVPFTATTAGAWALLGAGSNRWAAALFVVLGIYVAILARATHNEAHERADLMVRNAALVDDLERVNADLEAINADLELASTRDRLTGLANRRALDRYLSDAFIARANREIDDAIDLRGEIVALFIDLDGFKAINDTHGHHIGDEVLAITARRLTECLGDRGFLARYGGDEFVIVLPDCASLAPSLDLADAIVEAVAMPYAVDDLPPLQIGASVGVSISSAAIGDARTLLHDADTGLYRAKKAGRSRWMTAC